MAIEEGKRAPAFTLKDADGEKWALKDQREMHVIVYFYPRDDTPGCTKEACGFRDAYAEVEAAARADATVGEMMETMANVFGRYDGGPGRIPLGPRLPERLVVSRICHDPGRSQGQCGDGIFGAIPAIRVNGTEAGRLDPGIGL